MARTRPARWRPPCLPVGTNFQTLKVAQKAPNLTGGGYADAAFAPNPFVKNAITWVDGAVGKIDAELKARHLSDSTLVILTSKHGRSPADDARLRTMRACRRLAMPSALR